MHIHLVACVRPGALGCNNLTKSMHIHLRVFSPTTVPDVTTLQNLCIYIAQPVCIYSAPDVTTLQNLCIYISDYGIRANKPDVTTLQNLCIYIEKNRNNRTETDVTTLQNLCIYIRLTLFSCFNLAGCNPIHRETGEQSRQVRRRRFGIIRPYFVIYLFCDLLIVPADSGWRSGRGR